MTKVIPLPVDLMIAIISAQWHDCIQLSSELCKQSVLFHCNYSLSLDLFVQWILHELLNSIQHIQEVFKSSCATQDVYRDASWAIHLITQPNLQHLITKYLFDLIFCDI